MVKTYTAQSVSKNHDYNFAVDSQGDIIAMVVTAEVNYGTIGRQEAVDVWPLLSTTRRTTVQNAYNAISALFNSQFV